ncbi:hypothetical protein ATCC90586_008202 [Pythium insidiosum]|nr:hypothetical protein ATCC90586_008202 [Pythium insidiosum]
MPPQQRSSVAPGVLGSRSENLNTLSYRLCEHDELPTIDCKKAVKHVLIRAPRAQRRLNAFIHTTKRVWLIANLVGMTCVFTYPLFPLYWSRVVATAGAICVFVPVNLTLLVMRFDMIVLLMRTYEFWYLTAMNVLCTVLLSVEYADPRGFAIAIGSIAVQNGIMTDANYRVVKTVAFWSTLAALMYGGMAIAELLSALPDVRRLRIIRHSRWSVESNEVNANGLLTIAVIMLRNAYRRHAFVSTMKKDVPSVRLVSYRTYLRFVPSTRDVQAITPVVISPTPAPSSRLDPPPSEAHAYKQLQLAPTLPQIHLAVATSGLFVTITTGHLNSQLLRLLFTSFDPVFIFVQMVSAHVAVAMIVEWHFTRCLVIATSCLWSTWIITSDALTPAVRLKLGLSHSFDMAVVLTLIICSVLLLLLIFRSANGIQDRALFSMKINERTVQLSATSFVFTRVLMLATWWLRIAWRLRRLGDDGLVLLQGAVELEDTELLRRTKRVPNKRRRGWRRRIKPVAPRETPLDSNQDHLAASATPTLSTCEPTRKNSDE